MNNINYGNRLGGILVGLLLSIGGIFYALTDHIPHNCYESDGTLKPNGTASLFANMMNETIGPVWFGILIGIQGIGLLSYHIYQLYKKR